MHHVTREEARRIAGSAMPSASHQSAPERWPQ